MKSYKKALFPLAALLIAALTSCSFTVSDELYDMYASACATVNNADSKRIGTEITITMEVVGKAKGDEAVVMESGIAALITEVVKSGTESEISAEMTRSVYGETILTYAYYKDNIYYMDSMGSKIKTPLALNDVMVRAYTSVMIFPKSAVKKDKLIPGVPGDTGRELQFTLKGPEVGGLLMKQIGGQDEFFGESEDDAYGDVTVKAILDAGGTLKTLNLSFTITETYGGEKIKTTCEMILEVIELGGLEVNFPLDLDEYELVPGL